MSADQVEGVRRRVKATVHLQGPLSRRSLEPRLVCDCVKKPALFENINDVAGGGGGGGGAVGGRRLRWTGGRWQGRWRERMCERQRCGLLEERCG